MKKNCTHCQTAEAVVVDLDLPYCLPCYRTQTSYGRALSTYRGSLPVTW